MIQFALNTTTGDLLLDANGTIQLLGAAGTVTPDVLAQKLRIRLKLLKGDYVLDGNIGVPWIQAIVGKDTQGVATQILRKAIATCPGVATLDSFTLTVSSARAVSVSFSVTSTTGDPVTVADFVWGGP